MAVRDEPFEMIAETGGGLVYKGDGITNAPRWILGSGMSADWQPPPDNHWDYVEDQPMPGYWDCPYCGSVYPKEVLKCSQCGTHRRKG